MKRIYLAGPEVFLQNATTIGNLKKDLCKKYGYDGVYALGGTNDDEYSVYHPEQIHILGSQEDVENFKKFVANDNKI